MTLSYLNRQFFYFESSIFIKTIFLIAKVKLISFKRNLRMEKLFMRPIFIKINIYSINIINDL